MKTRLGNSKTAVQENDSYAETAVYQHVDKGLTKTKMYNSVNSPVRVDASEQGFLVTKIRTLVHVTEDRGVQSDSSNYEKVVSTEQVRDDNSAPTTSSGGYSNNFNGNDPEVPADGLSPLKVLKNFVDNIAADLRQKSIVLYVALAVAFAALVGVCIIAFG